MSSTVKVYADRVESCLTSSSSIEAAIMKIKKTTGRLFTKSGLRSFCARNGLSAPSRLLGYGSISAARALVEQEILDKKVTERLHTKKSTSADTLTRLMVIPDAHVPFEDPVAWDCMLKILEFFKPNTFASIGDFADMLCISSHDKKPDQMLQLKYEIGEARKRRAQLDKYCSEAGVDRKLITLGNHDIRPQRQAMKIFISLYDMLDPDKLLGFSENGWEVYPYQEHVKVGKLRLVHDVGNSGQNAAIKNGQAFEASTVQGHNHRGDVHYFGNCDGETHVSATIGWLGGKKAAEYLAKISISRNWQHGVGLAWIEPDDTTHFQFVPIINGRAVVNGKIIK